MAYLQLTKEDKEIRFNLTTLENSKAGDVETSGSNRYIIFSNETKNYRLDLFINPINNSEPCIKFYNEERDIAYYAQGETYGELTINNLTDYELRLDTSPGSNDPTVDMPNIKQGDKYQGTFRGYFEITFLGSKYYDIVAEVIKEDGINILTYTSAYFYFTYHEKKNVTINIKQGPKTIKTGSLKITFDRAPINFDIIDAETGITPKLLEEEADTRYVYEVHVEKTYYTKGMLNSYNGGCTILNKNNTVNGVTYNREIKIMNITAWIIS